MVRAFILSLLPLVVLSCVVCPPVRPQRYWIETCDLLEHLGAPGTDRPCLPVPINYIWVGVEVDLFSTTTAAPLFSCACGGRLTLPNLQVAAVVATWTCKIRRQFRQLVVNGAPFLFAPSMDPTLLGNLQTLLGAGGVFGFQTTRQFTVVNPVSPPTEPCLGGWVLKLWFKIITLAGQPIPSWLQFTVASGSTNPAHPLKIITPLDGGNVDVNGDVHFTTLDNVRYTFNAAGDYIYLRSKKPDFELQVRQVMTKSGSVLAAVGLKDHLTHDVVEIWWNGTDSSALILDGRKQDSDNMPINFDENGISNFGSFELSKNTFSKQLSVSHSRWGADFGMTVQYGGRASFSLKVPSDWDTEGLGGNKNGVKHDDLCFRDVERHGCVPLDAKSAQVHQFGLSWKANPFEMVFQRWMSVTDDELRYKRLPVTAEELEIATTKCFGDHSCAYDLISTGDKDFAHHTLHDSLARSFQKITYVGDDLVVN